MTTTSTTSTNRFLDMNRYYGTCPGHLPARTRKHAWASSMAACNRVLVVLIEPGGIDLGLPDLVNKLVEGIPGASSVIGGDLKARIVTSLRDWLTTTTDRLLEPAELALNRYTAAKPDKYGDVVVLRDSTATFGELKNSLFTASRADRVVDLVILTHGSQDFISRGDEINAARIRTMVTEFGKPLNLRSVYMMNCVGPSLNQAWLDIGARTSAGSHDNNYLTEPTTYFFFSAWKDGTPFEQAVTGAYRHAIDALNSALRGIVIGLVPLNGAALADKIDVSKLPFVVSSRPEVVGAGSLSIASDALPPASGETAGGASTSQSLVTTVLPPDPALVRPMSADRTVSPSGRTFISRFEAPGPLLDQRILAVERFLSDRIARPLTQPQIDALACFGIGIGSRAFEHSTLLRMLDEGDFAAVPGEIRKWAKIRNNGQIVESEALLERRRAEAELFGGTAQTLAVPASREVQEYTHQHNVASVEAGDLLTKITTHPLDIGEVPGAPGPIVPFTIEELIHAIEGGATTTEIVASFFESAPSFAAALAAIEGLGSVTALASYFASLATVVIGVVNAADTGLRHDETMGWVYGITWAIDNDDFVRAGKTGPPRPTGDAYNPTGVGDNPTMRKARFEQGVQAGVKLITEQTVSGQERSEAAARLTLALAIAVHQHGTVDGHKEFVTALFRAAYAEGDAQHRERWSLGWPEMRVESIGN